LNNRVFGAFQNHSKKMDKSIATYQITYSFFGSPWLKPWAMRIAQTTIIQKMDESLIAKIIAS
jgi:hypothetical protein